MKIEKINKDNIKEYMKVDDRYIDKEERLYFVRLFRGITSLLTGMKTTMTVFFRKKVTEQYPENRATLKLSDRFRGTLTMPHNDKNEHHCVACGLCQMACPNDTIKVTSEMIETEDGKKKKILAKKDHRISKRKEKTTLIKKNGILLTEIKRIRQKKKKRIQQIKKKKI